jgi:hypothetical protein
MNDTDWTEQLRAALEHLGHAAACKTAGDQALLTPKESAEYRRCSRRKQDRERAEGRGPAYVRIDGRIFYRRSDLDRFIAAHVRGGEFASAETTAERVSGNRRSRKGCTSAICGTPEEGTS